MGLDDSFGLVDAYSTAQLPSMTTFCISFTGDFVVIDQQKRINQWHFTKI